MGYDCADIREQLATLTGGSLRRTTLRRHVRDCGDCRAFYENVKRQRAAMAILLPVVPTAGLKSGVLSSVGLAVAGSGAGVGAGGGAMAGGGIAAAAASSAAKLAAVVAVAAVGIGAGVATVRTVEHERPESPTVSPAPSQSGPAGRQAARVALTGGISSVAASTLAAPAGSVGLGSSTRGVANGHSPKTRRGRSGTAPGRLGTAPGRAKTSPGRSRTSRGRARTSPGRSRSAPRARTKAPSRGRVNAAPGRTRSPTTSSSGGGGGDSASGSAPRVPRVERDVPNSE